jgi:CMP-N-acetylneuraminic acid synthetase
LIPTQNLEPWYEENSNLYIFTASSFSKTNARIGKRPIMYESPRFESIDIDTQADWEFAVIAAKYLTSKKND